MGLALGILQIIRSKWRTGRGRGKGLPGEMGRDVYSAVLAQVTPENQEQLPQTSLSQEIATHAKVQRTMP